MIIALILILFIIAYASTMLYLYRHQEALLFHPKHFSKDFKYTYEWEFEEYFLSPEPGVELNVIRFPVQNPKGAILFLHGNRGHLGKSGSYFSRVAKFGYDVILYDYRNYGKSTGRLSYKNLLSDGRFVFDWVKEQYGKENIIVHGSSLGTGIASFICSDNKPKMLILETPYYSIIKVAQHKYPFLPVQLLNKYPLSNARFLPKVKCQIHIIHGTADKTVPYSASVKLQKLNKNINLHTIEGGGHSNLKEFDLYHTILQNIYG